MAAAGAPRVPSAPSMIYRFGVFELDEEAGELRRRGEPVAIQPKPFELLRVLLREHDRVVAADELFELLWPGVAVTPSSLTRAVSVARRAIEDTHKGEIIQSVARRGYRFVGEVRAIDTAAARSAAGGPRAAQPGIPLVGRAAELDRLRAAFGTAADGAGGVAIVTGPPGIGKTRLVEALASEIGAGAPRVLIGRARDGEGVPAFWVFAQVLRQLLAEDVSGETLRVLEGGAGELADLLPELAPRAAERGAGADAAPEQSRFLFFEAVSRALARASRQWPIVLVLEDVQWAGPASLRLLEHLALDVAGKPIFVVATVRDEKEHPGRAAVERTLGVLRQLPYCSEIALASLARRDVAALLEQAIGRPAPLDLTTELFARTEGVPLFLREAIRLLADRGDLAAPERIRRWAVTLPAHVLDLIRRPVDRLSPKARELLEAGAVVGRELALPLAAAAADIPRCDALDLADEAERAGVLEPAPGEAGTWRFAHALYQEAIYAGLPGGRRARLHARIADALERQHAADPGAVIAELAHHHHQALAAGDPARAFERAVAAAEHARRLFAYEQAAMHWEQARAALEHGAVVEPQLRFETVISLAEAHRVAGAPQRAAEAFERALELARGLGEAGPVARAALGCVDRSQWVAQDDRARGALVEAQAALAPDAQADRARLRTRLAYLDILDGPAVAQPIAREAVAIARESGDGVALAESLYVLHFALGGPDFVAERAEFVRELVKASTGGSRRESTVLLLLDAASDALMVGDVVRAAELRAEATGVGGANPHPGLVWPLRAWDTGFALLEGRFADAERLASEAYPIGMRIDHPFARPVHRGHRALRAFAQGDLETVFRWFDPSRPFHRGAIQWTEAFVGRALHAAGREEEAADRLARVAGNAFRVIPRNIRWTGTIIEVAHLCADLADAARAAELAALLEPIANQHAVLALPVFYGGPAAHALARLYTLLGRHEEARELLDDARASTTALGARPALARIERDLALHHERHGSRPAAREHRAAATALSEELGLGL
jgi:DNA-binding winged helix-turn-helix (wHTH) protein/tetratricopeptide (TPR) repeat protein